MNQAMYCLDIPTEKRCGLFDCGAAFQTAINEAQRRQTPLYVPQGVYLVCEGLKLPSDFTLIAHPNARIKFGGERPKRRGEFLLTNADHERGNVNITVRGGVWDGNKSGPGNQKPDIFEKDGYCGAAMHFDRVRGLTLSGLTIANPTAYFFRMCRVEDFLLEDISLVSDAMSANQDGIHMGGGVKHGVIRNIRALSWGQSNDDLIAFNADDCVTRCENLDMLRGDIEDVTVENVFAENCMTAIRFLSVTAAIRNITVRHVCTGVGAAICLDAARGCRTPLFDEADYPRGCGRIENILIEDMTCWAARQHTGPAISMETLAQNFVIRDFHIADHGAWNGAMLARFLTDATVTVDGVPHRLEAKDDTLLVDHFTELTVNSGKLL